MKTTEYCYRAVAAILPALISVAVAMPAAFAQSTIATPVTGAAPDLSKLARTGLPTPGNYRINRNDTLAITCLNSTDYSVVETVLPDGTIAYPKMGQITVLGLTPVQLQAKITTFLKREYVKPQVSVAVQNRQVQMVSVIGTGIKAGGKIAMRDGARVLDAMADAGGLLSDRTELFTGKLIRLDTGQSTQLDLPAILKNDPAANVLLQPDDILIIDQVEESKSQIEVTGQVVHPGFYVIPRDGSIGKALEDAGGPAASAQLSQCVIERWGETITVDLRRMVQDGTEPEGIKLKPGDKLVVPENKRLFYIVGAVAHQGAVGLPDDRPMTLVRAMSDSGVQLQDAETKKTALTRIKPDGTQTTTIVDVEDLLKDNDYSKDIVLMPGDTIYVPYKKGRGFRATDVLGYVGAIPGLRYILDGFH